MSHEEQKAFAIMLAQALAFQIVTGLFLIIAASLTH